MPKHFNLLTLAILVAFVGLTATMAAGAYVCGDANGDGSVNVSDAVYVINYVFAGGSPPAPSCCYKTGTLKINPEPDSLDAPWSLTGQENFSASGTGDGTLTVTPGDYTFTWGTVPGWLSPPGGNASVAIGETNEIIGYYAEDPTGTITDIDGNVYQTIKIGNQWWMAENLKVTHYRNGDPIPNVTDGGTWGGLATGAYCDYNNDPANVAVYGRLYNWFAACDSRNIAPAGWHVPTDTELKQLEMYLGMSQAQADGTGLRGTDEGGKLKEAGTTHWFSPNTGATNESGFTALPGGGRNYGGSFSGMGDVAVFWSSSEGGSGYMWSRSLYYYGSQVGRGSSDKRVGFSVRCVRD